MKPFILFVLAGLLGTPLCLNASMLEGAMDQAASLSEKSTQKESGLVGTLMDSLGVTKTQAVGGTAALLNKAKSNMSGDDFSSLLSSVPGLSSISSSAASLLGSSSSLTDQFSALGMDSGMIGKFTSTLLGYVQGEGGTKVMSMLKSALL